MFWLLVLGNNFYSGGAENVLVKWFCENSEIRHYLPRLPANIVHLSVTEDSQFIAVSTEDNGIIKNKLPNYVLDLFMCKSLIIYIFLAILIINSQNCIHSIVQKFTWGVHASTVHIFTKYNF